MEGRIKAALPLGRSIADRLRIISVEEWERGALFVLETRGQRPALTDSAWPDRMLRAQFENGTTELGRKVGGLSWRIEDEWSYRSYLHFETPLHVLRASHMQASPSLLAPGNTRGPSYTEPGWIDIEVFADRRFGGAGRRTRAEGGAEGDLAPGDGLSKVLVRATQVRAGPWRCWAPLLVRNATGFIVDIVLERESLCGVDLGMRVEITIDGQRYSPVRDAAFGFPAGSDCRWRAIVTGMRALPIAANELVVTITSLFDTKPSQNEDLPPRELLDSEIIFGWSLA